MTGKELWALKEGNTLKFDRNINPVTEGTLYIVEYINSDRSRYYIRDTNTKLVTSVGISFLLNYAYIVRVPTFTVNTIEHKLNIGDEAWVMYDNAPYKDIIRSFYADFSYEDYKIVYQLAEVDNVDEPFIFATKEELIKSL